jgi:hypothetical protein
MQRKRTVGFSSRSAVNTPNPASEKVDFIRKGKKKKTITGFKENKNAFESKGNKFVVVEKEKKFEEAGVTRKKRNYVMYESKLGTEKERDMTKIGSVGLRKPQPRQEEKIIQKKKRKEYLDNYQYHETKEIRHPKPTNTSYVAHKRLGDIIGGFYEETTYERQVLRTDAGAGKQRQSSSVTRNKPNVRNIPSTQTYKREPRKSYPVRPSSSANKDRKPAVPSAKPRFSRPNATPQISLKSSFKKVGGRRTYDAGKPKFGGSRTNTSAGRGRRGNY